MRIHAFIFNWRGHEANAARLEAALSRHVKTTVVNSEELERSPPGWVDIGDVSYFSAQWNKALELFDGDLMFHVQADAGYDAFELLLERSVRAMENRNIGIYEPNVRYTEFKYDIRRLSRLGPQLFQVPLTDCTCWFVSGDVVRAFPPVNIGINRYGWGIPAVAAAVCGLLGKRCARDYTFTIQHPMGSSYSTSAARQHRFAYLASLRADIKAGMVRTYEAYYAARPGKKNPVPKLPKWLMQLKRQLRE